MRHLLFVLSWLILSFGLGQVSNVRGETPVPQETDKANAQTQERNAEEDEGPLPELMTPKLLWRIGRLSGSTLVSDGKQVVYGVRRFRLKDNAGTTSVFVKDLESGSTRELLSDWPSIGGLQAGNSPFGERVYFTGKPDKKEGTSPQVWSLNITDGGVVQVTSIEDGVANLKVAPTGTHIAFTRDVKLDDEVTELYEDLPEADARIIDSLMYRHWNAWHDYKYTHLHVAPIGPNGRAAEPIDLMKDLKVDCQLPTQYRAGVCKHVWP